MPPDTSFEETLSAEGARPPMRPERRRAAIVLAAVGVVALIGAGFALFGGHAGAAAAKAEDLAVRATSSVVDYAKSFVVSPVSLDGGRIAAAYPLPQQGRAIVANLSEMKVYLFEDGVASSTTYDILSRGRPGTAWETPPGSYAVKTKEAKHYSSIGHVWMPDSMQFQGNFFIHGWPYYDNGSPVPKGYSGGCIRMSTEDMRSIYDFGEIGTPVIVLGGDADALAAAVTGSGLSAVVSPGHAASSTLGSYELEDGAPSFPKLAAKSFVVGDLDTGDVFARRDEETVRPTASVAKLMTALVDLELLNQYETVEISQTAVDTEEPYGHLRVGETLTVADLLYPLILESSNDAAEQLAETAGHSYFMRSMNDKAASIGLTATNFDDPAGLSDKTVSTAADLFKLAQYVYRYKGFIFKTSLVKSYAIGAHNWRNSSKMLDDPQYAGGKHGYTPAAGKTLVATFAVPLSEFDKRNIAVVIMNSSDPRGDAEAAKKYLEKWVTWVPAASDGQTALPVAGAGTAAALPSA